MKISERITLADTILDAVVKLSQGNPGAIHVLSGILKEVGGIDPDIGDGVLLYMDDMGIRGPRIWLLFKDVCRQRLDLMIALLRAVQLGIISSHGLVHAIDNEGHGLMIEEICRRVKEELPSFQFQKTEEL